MGQKTVYYYHALSSPWAYLGWPQFKALIEKHDLDVVVRPTRIVPENGGVPLRYPSPNFRGHPQTLSWRFSPITWLSAYCHWLLRQALISTFP